MNIIYLCIIIFLVRIIDTTLGTVRTIITVKGKRLFATIISFVEVLIWFLIVKEAINTEEFSLLIGICYSLGFACGTYIGIFLTESFIDSNVTVNVIINKNKKLIKELTSNGYAVSIIKVMGKELLNNKYMLIIGTTYKRVKYLNAIIKEYEENAFITIEENKKVFNGYYNKNKK